MDVRSTVEALTGMGVRVHCERHLLIERTWAGLSRAKTSGTALARPKALDEGQASQVLEN